MKNIMLSQYIFTHLGKNVIKIHKIYKVYNGFVMAFRGWRNECFPNGFLTFRNVWKFSCPIVKNVMVFGMVFWTLGEKFPDWDQIQQGL